MAFVFRAEVEINNKDKDYKIIVPIDEANGDLRIAQLIAQKEIQRQLGRVATRLSHEQTTPSIPNGERVQRVTRGIEY